MGLGLHITERDESRPRHAGIIAEGWTLVHECRRPQGWPKYIYCKPGQEGRCHVCGEEYSFEHQGR